MVSVGERLRQRRFGLSEARELAAQITGDKAAVRTLVRHLFADEVEVRKRAADTARRITELDARPLEIFADELAGLLQSLPTEESRTRWHIALVVPRVAHTRLQRLRAARILSLLTEDSSNVVRCSAVEGLGTMALLEPSLREEAEALVQRFLLEGTPAMKCRARRISKLLQKKYNER